MDASIAEGFNQIPIESVSLTLKTPTDNVAVVSASGYLDTYNSTAFQRRINYLIDKGFINIIIDLGSTNYVSSTGIGSFTHFLKQIKPKGGQLTLCGVQPKVWEVFQLLGFSAFFNFKKSCEEAIAEFTTEEKKIEKKEESIFPFPFACPSCGKKLRAPKAGRFRCPNCKNIVGVNKDGGVFLA